MRLPVSRNGAAWTAKFGHFSGSTAASAMALGKAGILSYNHIGYQARHEKGRRNEQFQDHW
jgi:TRAP-type C4-dicarboxylate transport system permease large subunit